VTVGGIGVHVDVGVSVGANVLVAVAVLVGVNVSLGLIVSVRVGVSVGVSVIVGVDVLVDVGVNVGVAVGMVGVGDRRFSATLITSSRVSSGSEYRVKPIVTINNTRAVNNTAIREMGSLRLIRL